MGMRMVGLLLLGVTAALLLALLPSGERRRAGRETPESSVSPPRPQRSVTTPGEAPPPAEPAVTSSRLETRIEGPSDSLGDLRTLAGRVIWEDGAPVREAALDLYSSPLDHWGLQATGSTVYVKSTSTTDDGGYFGLEWVSGALWSLRVSWKDRVRAVVTEPPAAEYLEIASGS